MPEHGHGDHERCAKQLGTAGVVELALFTANANPQV
jgi:hypothetical protein